ncbi:amidohydrolase family protein [Actinoplanes sp. KI2]|uniref:amidohydrolase family protein n=1 Tax=Actinoplanes sp. KI2 TaxID=2983315 RepID=UPI0021D5938D|nr:amidohydrolase family protein [Actinoplanes sp. KI2]MCU7725536.1 amidohydrolase family protein [Actinoplanes sp. KI2]
MTSYAADSVWRVPSSDLSGKSVVRLPGTLLPGLIDAHVHSGLVDLATVRAGGIAEVWDLGSVPATVAALASAPADRKLPTIRYAGPFLIAPGGYPSDRSWAAPGSWRAVASPAEGAEAVLAAHAIGATLIKITAHAGGPQLGPPTMTAIADAAHRLGLDVVVHAEGPGTVRAAYEAGADLLAHTPWTEPLDPGLARACAARMRWISTLDIHGWGRDTPERATAIANLRLFLQHGGRVRYGTDLGNGPLIPGVNPREIRALQEAGLSPADILTAMTADAPAAMTAENPAAVTADAPAAPTDDAPATPIGYVPAGAAGPSLTWVPGGLDLDPARFADSLATARVLDDSVRPR